MPTSIVRTEKDKIICPGLEAVVPPVMQLYFDFGDLANSLLYLGCGLQLILVFLILSAASKAGVTFGRRLNENRYHMH